MEPEYAQKMKRLRTAKGQTPEEAAEQIGIPLASYRLYESGKLVPRDEVKLQIADFYQVDVYHLF